VLGSLTTKRSYHSSSSTNYLIGFLGPRVSHLHSKMSILKVPTSLSTKVERGSELLFEIFALWILLPAIRMYSLLEAIHIRWKRLIEISYRENQLMKFHTVRNNEFLLEELDSLCQGTHTFRAR
jgi:hypothetical protein